MMTIDICNTCGEFEQIAGIRLDGKKYCIFCLNDMIIDANTSTPTKEPEPLNSETIDELRKMGWLK